MAGIYYKDNLRQASFRGVPFSVEETEQTAGRRTQLHEYPQRDKPLAQDMGRASRMMRFNAFVVGADYIAQAQNLINALETFGPGELIHPIFGKAYVNALEPATVVFDRALGKATFNLSFVESGELAFPMVAKATQAITKAKSASLIDQAKAFFAPVFQAIGYINQVAQKALAIYGVIKAIITNPFQFGLSLFGLTSTWGNLNSLAAIFSSPSNLGQTTAAMLNFAPIAASGALTTGAATPAQADAMLIQQCNALLSCVQHPALADPLGATSIKATAAANPAIPSAPDDFNCIRQYLDKSSAYANSGAAATAPGGYLPIASLPTGASITPADRQAYVNTAATYGLVRHCLLAQTAALSSLLNCAVYDDVMVFRDSLCSAFDAETLAVSEWIHMIHVGDDARTLTSQPAQPSPLLQLEALHGALIDLRAAVWEDLTVRSRNSARLITVQIWQTTPALAIAYDLYEDATREIEIIARNKIINPAFVPPVKVQVLNQ